MGKMTSLEVEFFSGDPRRAHSEESRRRDAQEDRDRRALRETKRSEALQCPREPQRSEPPPLTEEEERASRFLLVHLQDLQPRSPSLEALEALRVLGLQALTEYPLWRAQRKPKVKPRQRTDRTL